MKKTRQTIRHATRGDVDPFIVMDEMEAARQAAARAATRPFDLVAATLGIQRR